MHTFRTLSLSLPALLLASCGDSQSTSPPVAESAQPIMLAAEAVGVTSDDIAGSVISSNGPEAGVWVIAETHDLPTLYSKTVVTDEQGRERCVSCQLCEFICPPKAIKMAIIARMTSGRCNIRNFRADRKRA